MQKRYRKPVKETDSRILVECVSVSMPFSWVQNIVRGFLSQLVRNHLSHRQNMLMFHLPRFRLGVLVLQQIGKTVVSCRGDLTEMKHGRDHVDADLRQFGVLRHVLAMFEGPAFAQLEFCNNAPRDEWGSRDQFMLVKTWIPIFDLLGDSIGNKEADPLVFSNERNEDSSGLLNFLSFFLTRTRLQ